MGICGCLRFRHYSKVPVRGVTFTNHMEKMYGDNPFLPKHPDASPVDSTSPDLKIGLLPILTLPTLSKHGCKPPLPPCFRLLSLARQASYSPARRYQYHRSLSVPARHPPIYLTSLAATMPATIQDAVQLKDVLRQLDAGGTPLSEEAPIMLFQLDNGAGEMMEPEHQ